MFTLLKDTKFDFLKYRYVLLFLSFALILASGVEWYETGDTKYGVDFRGGTDVVVQFSESVKPVVVRRALEDAGISGAIVQRFESEPREYSIRIAGGTGSETGKNVLAAISKIPGQNVSVLKQDYVGPTIGEQIRTQGLLAIALALGCILVYVSIRFEFSFALGGVLALLHDAAVTTGLVILSGREINGAVLASILTIVGYSINDTIVVFDRIRENFGRRLQRERKKERAKSGKNASDEVIEVINLSVNQTLSRTILTAATTIFVTGMLWAFGGGDLVDIGFTLTVGIAVGTYSSIYIASPIVLLYARSR